MAGDWIKWGKGLVNRREVLVIASRLGRDKHEIAGRLMVLWEWCDDNFNESDIIDDDTGDVSLIIGDNPLQIIDGILGLPAMAETMASPEVCWLSVRSGGRCVFPNLARHNGSSAKQRASEQKKKQNQRAKGKNCPDTEETIVPVTTGQQRDQSQRKIYLIDTGETETNLAGRPDLKGFLQGPGPDFEAFWSVGGRRTGKGKAFEEWQAAVAKIRQAHDWTDAQAIDWLKESYSAYVNSPLGREPAAGEKDLRWTPTTFLKDAHYDDDRQVWNRQQETTDGNNSRSRRNGGKQTRSKDAEALDEFLSGILSAGKSDQSAPRSETPAAASLLTTG